MHNLINPNYYMSPCGRVYVVLRHTYIEVSTKLWWLPASIRPVEFKINIV